MGRREATDGRNAFEATGRTAVEQGVWSHLQTLLTLRAQRPDLRRGRMVNLHAGEQTWVYQRGSTVVAINNGTTSADVTLTALSLGADVLKSCGLPRRDGATMVLTIPARSSCVF